MGKLKHGKWAKYKRMYKLEWEDDPNLRGWVAPVEGMETKAWCVLCRIALRAHKTDLMKHSESQKHKDNMSLYSTSYPATEEADSPHSDPEVSVVQAVVEAHNSVHNYANVPPSGYINSDQMPTDSPVQQDSSTSNGDITTCNVNQSSETSTKDEQPCIIAVMPVDSNAPSTNNHKSSNQQAEQTSRPIQQPLRSRYVPIRVNSTSRLARMNHGTKSSVSPETEVTSRAGQTKQDGSSTTQWLLVVEKERLAMERERLMIEKERLKVERERLALERERLMVEREHAAAYSTAVVVETSQPMVSVINQESATKGSELEATVQ